MLQMRLERVGAVIPMETRPRTGAGIFHRGAGFRGRRLEDGDRARLRQSSQATASMKTCSGGSGRKTGSFAFSSMLPIAFRAWNASAIWSR